jgi:hypothetical protein
MNAPATPNTANAQSTLAQTRQELVDFLSQNNRGEKASRGSAATSADRARDSGNSAPEIEPDFSWSSFVETGLSSWWHDHPARAGALLLRTAVEETARRKPLPTVAVAAVVGAAVVLIKPWRLVSTTAVMLTVFRSSNFTSVVTSLLEKAAQSLQKERT